MDKETKTLIKRIIKEYNHRTYYQNFDLGKIHLEDFIVDRYVFNPEKPVTRNLTKWMDDNKDLYQGKTVFDIGCGSGILGIVMALNGAMRVVFSDLSPSAIENTKKNVRKFKVGHKSVIVQGDLFVNNLDKADVIVFNHPFFLDYIIEDLLLEKPKFEKHVLIHRFLTDAKAHLKKEGCIIMPYLHLAGRGNDPGIQATKHGYVVEKVFRENIPITKGKVGPMSIYKLSIRMRNSS